MKHLIIIFIVLFIWGCGENSRTLAEEQGTSIITNTQSPALFNEERPLLVIRIEYDNQEFVNSASVWATKIFGTREHQLNHYFLEVSARQFSFVPASESDAGYNGRINDGVVSVHLNKLHPDSGSSTSIHSDLKLAYEEASAFVNFKNYDTDNSRSLSTKELTTIFIIAGAEDSYASTRFNGVWAHASCMSNSAVVDGMSVSQCSKGGDYAIFGERHIDSSINAHDATIGIIAHELGHEVFNLPDLYPTNSTKSSGIGYFGLMGGGLWGTDSNFEEQTLPGNTPTHMCAWSKVSNKWVTPQELHTAQEFHLNASDNSSYNVAKISLSTTRYLLLENRSRSGYDKGLFTIDGFYQGGVAIWQIDESVIANTLTSNTLQNDKNNKGVDLLEARDANIDNAVTKRGHANNLFFEGNVNQLGLNNKIIVDTIGAPSTQIGAHFKGL